jgi:hypothetical protein
MQLLVDSTSNIGAVQQHFMSSLVTDQFAVCGEMAFDVGLISVRE